MDVAPLHIKDDQEVNGQLSQETKYVVTDPYLGEPQEPACKFQDDHLTSTKNISSEYNLIPQREEGSTQCKGQALTSDSPVCLSGGRSSTGNVWDMLVNLLGTEDKTFMNSTEKTSASPPYESEYLISAMTSCNQEKYENNISTATNTQANDHRMSVLKDYYAYKHKMLGINDADNKTYKHKFPLPRSELQFCYQLVPDFLMLPIPKKNLDYHQIDESECSNKVATVCKASNNTISVKMYKADQSSLKSSVLSDLHLQNDLTSSIMTKSLYQQDERSKYGVSKLKRKGLGMCKQREKIAKKTSENVSLGERSKPVLPGVFEVSELSKAITEHQHQGIPLAYPSVSVQGIENEMFLQNSAVQVSKTLDRLSLKKSTSLTVQNYKESQDVCIQRGTSEKSHISPACHRLHSVLISNQEYESDLSNTLIIDFDLSPTSSAEKQPVMRHLSSTNQNQSYTKLFMSQQASELPNEAVKFTTAKISEAAEPLRYKHEADVNISLINEFTPSDDMKLKEFKAPGLSNNVTELPQPKTTETWEEKNVAHVRNGSKSLGDKILPVRKLAGIRRKLGDQKRAEILAEELRAIVKKSFTNVSESSEDLILKENGVTTLWDMRKLPRPEEDFVPSDRSHNSYESCSVNNTAHICPSRTQQNSYKSPKALEGNLSSEQQLKLLLHANQCQLPKCVLASCVETKQLLKHCSWCRLDSLCPVPCCSVSRSLLQHWDICKVFHCPLCSSLRQCYGHVKFFIKDISTTRSYSSDFKKIVRFAPHRANSSSNNVANTLTSTRHSKVTVRNSSHSIFPFKSYEATSPKRVNEPQRQDWFTEKYKYKFSGSVLFDRRNTRRYLAQHDQRPQSAVRETRWEVPCSSSDWNESLDHVCWNESYREDIHQESSAELASKSKEDLPKFAAGFTVVAQHLRDRLDCLLHGVVCEVDYKSMPECTVKHCSIMKSTVNHISTCGEFKLCSDVICALFRPLFLHWKECYGPCAVCGPVNMKYNKKKLLEKLPSTAVKSESVSEEDGFGMYKESECVWRQEKSRESLPHYPREHMTEEQLSVPAIDNGYTVQLDGGERAQEAVCSYAGNNSDHLTGIDMDPQRLLENIATPFVTSTGFLDSDIKWSSLSSSSLYNESDATSNRSMQDLCNAISLYNFHSLRFAM